MATGDGPRGSRRDEVLELLRSARDPLGVAEVAERLGVHVNTARFHLEALVTAGSVVMEMEPPSGPGRPRAAYRPRPGMDRGGSRGYFLLAQILLSRLGAEETDAVELAQEAGRAWGQYLVDRPAPFHRTTGAEALGRLEALLSELDFDPQVVPAGSGGLPSSIRLRHCPFLELAEQYGPLVCNVHLGLTQGALRALRAPVATTGIHPFAEAGACRLDVGPADPEA